MRKLFETIILSLVAIALVGCNKATICKNNNQFGDFDYNGIFLKEYAVKKITVEQAKTLVDINNPKQNHSYALKKELNRANEKDVTAVLTKYASLTTTVKYYVSDKEEQQVRQDIYQGTDFKYLLDTNHYEPFGQMSVKYIFVDDDLLDAMEIENTEFKEANHHYVTPFNELYTYHTDNNNNLVVQTHSFAELPASTGGGIGSTFRQDCELLFDEEGKITLWQSSLGLYTSTPTGTVKQGYIFEVEFAWENK